jgi:hypothetical protein
MLVIYAEVIGDKFMYAEERDRAQFIMSLRGFNSQIAQRREALAAAPLWYRLSVGIFQLF